MAKVGAQRAAVLTGRSKSTIQRAMNAGKLSYEQDSNGRRVIDVSELERVFGIVSTKPQAPAQQNISSPASVAKVKAEVPPNLDEIAVAVERERMSMMIKMLEQQLATATEHLDDLKMQRDKWERQATQVLITSQYSQKQAEELRSQLKEREERAKLRRLQYEERFARIQGDDKSGKLLGNSARPAQADNERRYQPSSPKPQVTNRAREAEKLDEQMKKLKAENQNAQKSSGSVFRFWKKVSA